MRVGLSALKRSVVKVKPRDLYQIVQRYSGAKQAKYRRACDDVSRNGVLHAQSKLTAFVKDERAYKRGDPRIIQFRDPRYCVALAKYTHAIEEVIYPMHGGGEPDGLPAGRIVGKGLNMAQRAMLLFRKMAQFNRAEVISIDMSRFDKHVSRKHLKLEHEFYLHCVDTPELRKLLRWQLTSYGKTRHGVSYKNVGGRASGDMTTALGNIVIVVMMVASTMIRLGHRWDVLDDGDDCLVLCEARNADQVAEALVADFRDFGMTVRIEGRARHMEGVEWCQSRPVEYHPGKWKFVRNPHKVIPSCLTNVKYGGVMRVRRRMVKAVGLCELVLNQGVPILQHFAAMLVRSAGGIKPANLGDTEGRYWLLKHELSARRIKLEQAKPAAIHPVARASFARAFGVPEAVQRYYEDMFDSMTLQLNGSLQEQGSCLRGVWEAPYASPCIELWAN
jgi:hypothetical protein